LGACWVGEALGGRLHVGGPGRLGFGNVGRRKQICFQKVGGSSIVVRKLIGRGGARGSLILIQVGVFFWTSCIKMHAYYSNYILQDLNEVFLPTYCISQLWPVYLLRGRSLLKVAFRTKDLRRRVCNQVISFDIQIH
jgi:hypothetical protein